MRRKILIVLSALLCGMALAVIGVGELLSGPVPTAVSTLLTDVAVEPVQISRTQWAQSGGVKNDTENEKRPIKGWLLRGVRGRGVILLVHSLRSNRVEMLSRARFLNEQGYGALLIDLQAHGETYGDEITFGVRESQDIEAAVDYLRNAFPGERRGAIGVSLGAAAIVLAKNPLGLDAVVLESLHPTLREAVENRLKLHLGEFGPILTPLLLWQISPRFGVSPEELDPIRHIGDLNTPVLLISGTDDRHTTVPETERLFDAARQPKELWIVPGGGHFNMHSYAGKEYENRISDFFHSHLQR
ncbi:MAG TPA: alpha/beta fold hydrolase [Nitrosospira sp.]|nr:alpha/beta fold hydrolase [Nitrosospira sp.]